MQLLTFKDGESLRLGVKTEAGIIDVAAAAAELGVSAPASVEAVLDGGAAALASLKALVAKASGVSSAKWRVSESKLIYGPSVPDPGKIICVGLNYRKHAEETNSPIPTSPVLFSKFSNTIAANNDSVPLPSVASQYDYEAELCVVIGKRAKDVSEGEALDYVFGYTNADDVSVRDLQNRTSQWLLGKTLDRFFPIGPYLVTSDEVGNPQNLKITCKVNGELRQNSNTSDMIYSVPYLVSYISKFFALEPGDVITTGTPEGVAMGMPNKPWLVPGDEVVVEIEKLGTLRNVTTA